MVDKLLKHHNKFRIKENEKFCSKVLFKTLFDEKDWETGDVPSEHLPDMYRKDRTHGIEIVQIEREQDFKYDLVHKKIKETNNDAKAVKKFFDEKYKDEFDFIIFNNKIVSFWSKSEKAHAIDWMFEKNKIEIEKKFKKLGRGNYGGIKDGNIDLCVSIIQRCKDFYDVKLILYSYFIIKPSYDKVFKNIYIVTSSKLYVAKPENIETIEPVYDRNIICDLKIKGNNVFKEYEL